MDKLLLKEISTIAFPLKIYQPFCLSRGNSEIHSLLSKSDIRLLNLRYKYLSDNNLSNFLIETAKVNSSTPTEAIKKDLTSFFENSSTEERHAILLDSILIPSLSSDPPNVRLVQQEWSPNGLFQDNCLLMTLTNFGVVDLYARKSDCESSNFERNWTSLVNVTDIWKAAPKTNKASNPGVCSNYKSLKEQVDLILIKCVAWSDKLLANIGYISCFVECGTIAFFRVKEENKKIAVKLLGCSSTSPFNIHTMKWVSTPIRNVHLLLCGCSNGQIVCYKLDIDENNDKIECTLFPEKLWSETDKIPIKSFQIFPRTELNQILVIAIKGAHILLFLLDFNGKLIDSEVFFGDHLEISAITAIGALTYLVCTTSGHLEVLKVCVDHDEINYTTGEVNVEIDLKKWRIYGVTSSANYSFVVFATSPALPYDHLGLRNTASLVMCSSSYTNNVETLVNNPTYSLRDFKDVAETIRLQILKNPNDYADNLMGSISEQIELTDRYIYQHKLRLVEYASKSDYYRMKSERRSTIYQNYIQASIQLIQVYTAYKNLNFLHNYYRENNSFTTNQINSLKSMRIFLHNFLEQEIFEEYTIIQLKLKSMIQDTITKTVYIEGFESENCIYCGQSMPEDKLDCENKHKTTRCFYSQLQIPFFECSWCYSCKRQCLKYTTLCEMFKLDSVHCVFCDSKISQH